MFPELQKKIAEVTESVKDMEETIAAIQGPEYASCVLLIVNFMNFSKMAIASYCCDMHAGRLADLSSSILADTMIRCAEILCKEQDEWKRIAAIQTIAETLKKDTFSIIDISCIKVKKG